MAYCTGGCIDWDEMSGLLTIAQDPLGGLECTAEGQKVRIAGNTTGVTPSANNNGLFFTSTGELGTKIPGQRKAVISTSATQAINATVAPTVTSGPYAGTSTISMTNPSSTYPMFAFANYTFNFDVGMSGTGSILIKGDVGLNGGFTEVSDYMQSGFTGTQNFRFYRAIRYMKYVVVPPAATYTFAASQHWSTGTSLGIYSYYSAATAVEVVGFAMEEV